MRIAIITLCLVWITARSHAQDCDIATTGVTIVNPGNTAPLSSICEGEQANFKFTIANLGTSLGCTIPAGSVSVVFDFPTIGGGIKPYVYSGPANFISGFFSWTYNSGAEVLEGVNILPIPNGVGDIGILVPVTGNAPASASSNINITQNGGISNNTSNDIGSAQLTVRAKPVVTCPTSFAVCISEPAFTLTGASPSGGTYSGTGVSGGQFNPATAGAGMHTISYTYLSTGTNCSATCTFTITVNPLPTVTCPADFSICSNAAAITLSGGSPAGGTYSGTGVSSGQFNPATAGAGAHIITYSYTDGNGCTANCTFTITVNAAPVVTCPANSSVCIDATPFALVGATPAGGTYSGPGVNSGTFNPATAGAGTHTINYSYTDGNGCSGSCSFTITVNALPIVACPANSSVCIDATPFALAGATPAGGTYSGPGVASGTFNPATAGAGTHTINYSYTDGNGCSASCSFTITVNALPIVTCPANSSVCIDATPFALTGATPAGGTYSGPGVTSGTFSPSAAGAGVKTINYTYTDGNGCTANCTFTITVNALPIVACPANSSVCIDATPFVLSGATPAGGTYSGPGVASGTFNPTTAGAGTHTINYSFTDGNGCSASCSFTITVNALPVVNCPVNSAICINAAPFALAGATPAGGTYSGTGVSGGIFSPAVAGAGSHTITYTYTDVNSCVASCSFTIRVDPLPVVTCPASFTICSSAASVTLTGGAPVGGSYSGTGVSAGQFNPGTAGAGSHMITYSYTDPVTGCSSSCTFTITVTATAVVTCPASFAVCTNTAPFALTGGSPVGGTYSGTGVSAGVFSPAVAGPGAHIITYTQGGSCPGTCTFTITVNTAPTVTCPASFSICSNAAPVTLTGGLPAGGTYSGTGVSGGQFNPALAGPGAHTITYSFTDGNSCTASCTFTITVNPAPVMTCPSSFTICVSAAPVTLTGGLPAGGTYSGTGVSGGQFNPATAGTGAHVITYTSTSGGCTNSCSFTITVTATASVTCPANQSVCTNIAPFALTGGSPVGGTYSGTGVSAGVFSPAVAGPGTHTITYSQGAGCPGTCTFSITVNTAPTVTCPASFSICSNAAPVTLTGGLPAGGTYSGTGVSGGQFNPALAGPGAHTITYSFTDGNSCTASCTFTITVNPAPVMTCPSSFTICVSAAPVTLTGGLPAGGTYSGTGVSGGQFNPATAGTGAHVITYTSTSGGCTNSCSFTITVTATASVTCPANLSVCTNTAPFALTGGSPVGGTYSGTGVSAGVFSPAVAGPGTHTITYSQGAGCPGTCTFTITVNTAPTVTCPASFSICSNAAPVTLTGGLPAGGTYSGTGVSGGQFNPALAGPGAHSITYSFTDGNSCTASCTFTITVNPAPVMTCPSSFTICVSAAPVTLTGGLPAGGTYSGTGVSGGQFNPATAGTGAHVITYTSTSGGCTNSCSFTITVTATASVTCPANQSVCTNTAPFALTGGSPVGGTYSGTGVSAGVFSPAIAGPGTHTITYSQGAGCPGTCTFTITVNTAPTVTCPTSFSICSNAAPVTLTGGLPAGGIYSGTGVSGGQFNPALAGPGAHTITYSFTDGNSCTASCTFTITVNAAPVLSCPAPFTVCTNEPAFALSGASPAGGTYSGTGVSGGIFNPAIAGTGTHTITYTYTDGNGCTASCSFTISVSPGTTFNCPAGFSVCTNDAPIVLSGGTPTGGFYSGPGVSLGIFNPAVAGPGTHTITYGLGGSCGGSCSFTITVNALPVVSCPAPLTACSSQTAFLLPAGTPAGGTYSGPGVSTNIFNPAFANSGANTITYTYTGGNGCSNSCSFIITVNSVTASISGTTTVPVNPGANSPVTFTANGGTANYTFTYRVSVNGGPPGAIQTVTTSGSNSTIVLQSNAISGTYSYQLLSVTDANGCTGSINSPGNITIAVVAGAPLPGPDITASQLFSSLQLTPGTYLDEVIVIRNVGTGSTTAPIVFTATNYAAITGLSAASYPGSSLTIGFTNYTLDNANWTINSTSSVLTFTSNAGVVIPPGGSRFLGVRISRAAGANGQVTHTITIVPNTGGGETPTSNNTISNTLLKN